VGKPPKCGSTCATEAVHHPIEKEKRKRRKGREGKGEKIKIKIKK